MDPDPTAHSTPRHHVSAPSGEPISNDELLFLRASLSLCAPDGVFTCRMIEDTSRREQRSTATRILLQFLYQHRFMWHFHPDQVIERLDQHAAEQEAEKDIPALSFKEVEDAIDAVKLVLLPVTVDMHPSHLPNVKQSEGQTRARSKRALEQLTPQEREQQEIDKEQKKKKRKTQGCLHSGKNLCDILIPMFRLQCWNRTETHAATKNSGLKFKERIKQQLTTFGDIYTHHDLLTTLDSANDSRPSVIQNRDCKDPPQPISDSNPPSGKSKKKIKKDMKYIRVEEISGVLRKRRGALKAADTRESKTSEYINSHQWEGANGALRMTGISLSTFAIDSSLRRRPLPLQGDKLCLHLREEPVEVRPMRFAKQHNGEGTLSSLGRKIHHATVTSFTYKFPNTQTRHQIALKTPAYLNLRPSEPASKTGKISNLGINLRQDVRVLLDFTSGELTYKPRTKSYVVHLPALTTKLTTDRLRTMIGKGSPHPAPSSSSSSFSSSASSSSSCSSSPSSSSSSSSSSPSTASSSSLSPLPSTAPSSTPSCPHSLHSYCAAAQNTAVSSSVTPSSSDSLSPSCAPATCSSSSPVTTSSQSECMPSSPTAIAATAVKATSPPPRRVQIPKATKPLSSWKDYGDLFDNLIKVEPQRHQERKRIIQRMKKNVRKLVCSASDKPSDSTLPTDTLPSLPKLPFKDVPGLPPELRPLAPGNDAFGEPYIIIDCPKDAVQNYRNFLANENSVLSSNQYGIAGDPNIISLYTVYLPNSGSTMHIGKGWAHRVYNKWGKRIDDHQSAMDTILHQQVEALPDLATMNISRLRQEKARLKLSLEKEHQAYRRHRAAIYKVSSPCFFSRSNTFLLVLYYTILILSCPRYL